MPLSIDRRSFLAAGGALLPARLKDDRPVRITVPQAYLQALAAAVERGVDIQIIVTNLSARPDGLSAGSSSSSTGSSAGSRT